MQTTLKHQTVMIGKTFLSIDFQHFFTVEDQGASCEVVEELGISKEELQILKQRINRA